MIELEPTEVQAYDVGLVRRLKVSPEAFEEYMQVYGTTIMWAVYQRLGNWHDAEDVHMDALEAALGFGTGAEAWQPGKGRSFKAWVWVLADQRASKVLRRRKREQTGVGGDVAERGAAGWDAIAVIEGSGSKQLSPRAAKVRKVFERLSDDDQLLFRFKFGDQLSNELIAEKLGVKLSTVRVKIHRLLERVKKHLDL